MDISADAFCYKPDVMGILLIGIRGGGGDLQAAQDSLLIPVWLREEGIFTSLMICALKKGVILLLL